MNINEYLYIVSVSFQFSGAILLLIKYCFVNIDKGIRENKKKETHVELENLVCSNTQPTASEYTENVWINRFAFALIVIGYLLSTWSSINNSNRLIAFICVLLLSTVITTLLILISKKLSSKKNSDL